MRNFNLHGPLTLETLPEQAAIRSHEIFHQWKAYTIDYRIPNPRRLPQPVTRRLVFRHHLPISCGIYILLCDTTLEKVDDIQDMLIQMGFTIRGMRRRIARAESVDDGKVEYLEHTHRAWVSYLGQIWKCMTMPGMRESSRELVRKATELVPVTEEVAEFVRDMDFHGVGFLTAEWDEEARLWTEAMLMVDDWLSEGEYDWRGQFCAIVQGKPAL